MHHVISSVDWISDRSLHSHCLEPRFSNCTVDVAVSSEERHVHANLVHSYPKLFRGYSDEAWNVSTAKNSATNSILHDHFNWAIDLLVDSIVISSPVSAKLLGAEEERTGKYKGPEGALVTSDQTTVGLSLLRSAVCVVELTVLN